MKKSTGFLETNGTSFHGNTVQTTPRRLIALADKFHQDYCAENTGDDKFNFHFEFETDCGIPYTVYDWKEYKTLKMDKLYHFHIGAHSKKEANIATRDLIKELNKPI